MPGYTLGRLSFDKDWRGRESGQQRVIAIHDCAPPPRGSRLDGNPQANVPAEVQPTFLQPSEIGRIVHGAAAAFPAPHDFPSILNDVLGNLGIKGLDIDISLVPAGWHMVTPCFRTVIAYEVEYEILDIDVSAAIETVFGSETFPAGDRIASFRVLHPKRYRFVRRHEHNPACCGEKHEPPSADPSDWYPESERDINFKFGLDYEFKNYWHDPFKHKGKYNYYQGEDSAPQSNDDDLRRQLEELRRQLREIREQLRKLIGDGGN